MQYYASYNTTAVLYTYTRPLSYLLRKYQLNAN